MPSLSTTALSLRSLTLFRKLLEEPVLQKFLTLADASHSELPQKISAYADFAAALFAHRVNFTEFLLDRILCDENVYMLKKSEGKPVDELLEKSLLAELTILEEVGKTTPTAVRKEIAYEGYLPEWKTENLSYRDAYLARIENIHCHGYGIFAKYHTFMVVDGVLTPVKHPDEIALSALGGYEYERGAVIQNTLALLEGKPAANVLLYGDAGTGKSSTVKAVANEYRERGLRLIELKKNQLHQIPNLVDYLTKNPLKFILFIDDLSFTKNDDDFAALKAILEGSVSARANNLAVYATSNRRHLIRETFTDRAGDEIHQSDTIEELGSLSARFGLTITFSRPQKDIYLSLAHKFAVQYGIDLPEDQLNQQAEAFAISRGGRSPRAAKQFVEHLAATF